jgi:hypothetical protein
VLFRGYVDESYNEGQKIFALSCLTSYGKLWLQMERAWKLHLASKNRKLKKARRRQISRYHASDCSGRHGEFEGWTHDERDEFVKGLFGIFKRVPVHAVGMDVNLDDLCEVFPELASDRLEAAYFVLTQALVYTIGEDYFGMSKGRPVKITLFHDRTTSGKYDPTILRAFSKTVVTSSFPYKGYFTTIAALSWEDCIALQPADLVAFEIMKDAEAREQARQERKSFKALLALEEFGIHSKTLSKTGMIEMREMMVRDGIWLSP